MVLKLKKNVFFCACGRNNEQSHLYTNTIFFKLYLRDNQFAINILLVVNTVFIMSKPKRLIYHKTLHFTLKVYSVQYPLHISMLLHSEPLLFLLYILFFFFSLFKSTIITFYQSIIRIFG